MDVITQTNRTILFEEINPEKNDLLTLIGECDKKLHNKLLVVSYPIHLG